MILFWKCCTAPASPKRLSSFSFLILGQETLSQLNLNAGDQPSFEPTAEQLVFKGDSSNVDDVQAHEARVSTLRQSLAQQRQDWDAKVKTTSKCVLHWTYKRR